MAYKTQLTKQRPSEAVSNDLSAHDLDELRTCEEALARGLQDFVAVGNALATIKTRKLYRGRQYSTFSEYCQRIWGLPRSTAHLKIKVSQAYTRLRESAQSVGVSLEMLPKNESQVRPLLVLRTPDLQWQAWEAAMAEQEASGSMTADVVRHAANGIRSSNTSAFRQYLTVDSSFPAIPFRLDLYAAEQGTQPVVDMERLLAHYGEVAMDDEPTTSPLVLVSPHYDLFGGTVATDRLHQLLAVLSRVQSYRFLLWTPHIERVPRLADIRGNIELAIRVPDQNALDVQANLLRGLPAIPNLALGVDAVGPLALPSLRFSRILISNPKNAGTRVGAGCMRQLMISTLSTGIPLHITAEACNALGEVPQMNRSQAQRSRDGISIDDY